MAYYNPSGQNFEMDEKKSKSRDPILVCVKWVQQRSSPEKIAMGVLAAILGLVFIRLTIRDINTLFVLAELAHIGGLAILIYKLVSKKSCAGLSLRTQNLTALFLAVRLYCSVVLEKDIHTLLDLLTFAATIWVVVMILTRLKHTWQKDADTTREIFVIVPCVALAVLAHPTARNYLWIHRVLWAFCVYLEAVSVLPQLRMMQNNKVVERFTGHYVFALALQRFFSCAHWVLQLFDKNSYLKAEVFHLRPWPVMLLVSEAVQTLILADFCYYYVKAYTHGSGFVQLPV